MYSYLKFKEKKQILFKVELKTDLLEKIGYHHAST